MNPRYNVWLTTLENVQNHQSLADTSLDWDALQLSLLRMFIAQASMQMVTLLRRLPLPHIETRLYDYQQGVISPDGKGLLTDNDLLAVTTAINGNGSTVDSANYVLAPNNIYPRRMVKIKNGGSLRSLRWVPASDGQTDQVISVAGLWGYIPHYGREWKASGATVSAGGLTNSAPALTLAAGQGTLFQTGQYLRIGEEFLWIANVAADTLHVERGVLGSDAAAHAPGEVLEIYQQLWDIEQAATEWAAYLYKSKDRVGDNVQLFDNGVRVVNGLSPLVQQTVRMHRYVSGGHF